MTVQQAAVAFRPQAAWIVVHVCSGRVHAAIAAAGCENVPLVGLAAHIDQTSRMHLARTR
jgi:hypothetical protein